MDVEQQKSRQQEEGIPKGEKTPIVCIFIGMAGSGKSTVMQALTTSLFQSQKKQYVVNLDPAVLKLNFAANIDIRDTVNYKEVMKQYQLGPNGGILTSLNLFTTKFDQVLALIDKRKDSLDYVMIDTPGQIEIFTWSASGKIITESLAATYPTVIVYIVDTPRTISPVTFMSNMLYACSILYKTKLPFVIVFNKIDVADHGFAVNWMNDFSTFQNALRSETTYMSSLTSSLALVLEEFYQNLKSVGLSAITGVGVKDFFQAVEEAKGEYYSYYRPNLLKIIAEREKKEKEDKEKQMEKLKKDLQESKGMKVVLDAKKAPTPGTGERFELPASDVDDEDDEDDEEERKEFEKLVKMARENDPK